MPVRTKLLLLALIASLTSTPDAAADRASDLAAARALFERNIAAIQNRDRDAYLDCYRHDASLVRTGATGMSLGFEGLERSTSASGSDDWPDTLIANDLQVTWLRDGLVYGTYRYRVVFDGVAGEGISERVFLRDPGGWVIAVSTAFNAPPGVPPPPVALVGATVHDGTGGRPLRDAVVIVRNGRIDTLGTRRDIEVPAGMDVVDLSGHHVTPGMIDTHVHYSQTGWADGRPDAADVQDRYPYETSMAENRLHPERFHRAFLACGVTGVFDVGGYPWTFELPGDTEDALDAPHVATTGPLLVTFDVDALRLPDQRQMIYMENEAAVQRAVRSHAAQGAGAIKVWFVVASDSAALEWKPLVMAAGRAAREAGLPMVVHATTLATARIAVEAGAHLLVHSVEDTEVDDAFVRAVKDAGTHYCPTLIVRDGYIDMYSARITDALRAQLDWVDPSIRERVLQTTDLPPRFSADRMATIESRSRAQAAVRARNVARLHRAGVPVAMGTDAGNPLTLHGPSVFLELEAMQAAGMKPAAVLVAATRDAARAMGRGDDLGVIAPGRLADLVVLERDPSRDIRHMRSITHVMRGGRLHARSAFRP